MFLLILQIHQKDIILLDQERGFQNNYFYENSVVIVQLYTHTNLSEKEEKNYCDVCKDRNKK